MKKLIALIVVVLLLWPSVAFASTIRDRTQFLYQQVQELEAEPLGAEVRWDEKTGEITIKQGL